ncbi:hypothetical protein M8J75_008820 [Diaphorina citri]|nr:hypothetical protein M8J75_008820 [Diaphorina citri]
MKQYLTFTKKSSNHGQHSKYTKKNSKLFPTVKDSLELLKERASMISRKSILKKSSTPDNNTELYDEPIDLSSDDEEIRLFPAKDSIEILNKRSKSFLKVSKSRGDDQFDNKVKESHTAGRKQHGGNREDRGESVHVKYYDTD